jgi:hypothetical protein
LIEVRALKSSRALVGACLAAAVLSCSGSKESSPAPIGPSGTPRTLSVVLGSGVGNSLGVGDKKYADGSFVAYTFQALAGGWHLPLPPR